MRDWGKALLGAAIILACLAAFPVIVAIVVAIFAYACLALIIWFLIQVVREEVEEPRKDNSDDQPR